MKTGLSKYYPQNTTIMTPKGKTEIFWQTKNANHLLESYTDRISQFNKDHDLKFSDFKDLFSNYIVVIRKIKNTTNKYYAISYLNNRKRYYFIIFALEKRFDHLFAVIITAYATKKAEHIRAYKEYKKYN